MRVCVHLIPIFEGYKKTEKNYTGSSLSILFWNQITTNTFFLYAISFYYLILTLITLIFAGIRETATYTCVAASRWGVIESKTTVRVQTLPRPPENLRATEITPTSVKLSWSYPGKITQYLDWRKENEIWTRVGWFSKIW